MVDNISCTHANVYSKLLALITRCEWGRTINHTGRNGRLEQQVPHKGNVGVRTHVCTVHESERACVCKVAICVAALTSGLPWQLLTVKVSGAVCAGCV